MSNMESSKLAAVRAWIDRLFETLERAKLKDLERSIARAANEREVSQRVHRLEAGEAPFG
jgi:hypothetical protein